MAGPGNQHSATDFSVRRPWAGSLVEAPTDPQML